MKYILLKFPVLWHSSRVPSGYNYSAMTSDQRAMLTTPFRNWYTADWNYGLATIFFFCAGIGLLALLQLSSHLREHFRARSFGETGINRIDFSDRLTAASRYISAQQYRTRVGNWYSPSLGVILGLGIVFGFIMGLSFAVKPLYWPNPAMGHSPPLGTRTGWISIAIMPFMIALASKANYFTALLGTSHEKLQVWHRWLALFMYITSLLHTFPFIYMNIKMGEMIKQYTTSTYYWSGIAALVPQTYLMLMSWGYIRSPYYETFKKMHFIVGIVFLLFLFFHCQYRLSSWDYFWATLAIYFTTWLFRLSKSIIYNSNLFGLSASVQCLPGDMVNVSIPVPSRINWKPGQHVFVRFLSGAGFLHSMSQHPFTVISLPKSSQESPEKKIDLVFRSYTGITRQLQRLASGKASLPARVIVDGPYGGCTVDLKGFDSVWLMAEGSGATFTVPLLMDLVRGFTEGKKMRCKHVEFVLAVRGNDSPAWLVPYLAEARSLVQAKLHNLRLHIHVTRANADPHILSPETSEVNSISSAAEPPKAAQASSSNLDSEKETDIRNGRPDLPVMIYKACREQSGRIAVAACGPSSFVYDVRNAVAQCQLNIMDGFGSCNELFLHTEKYEW